MIQHVQKHNSEPRQPIFPSSTLPTITQAQTLNEVQLFLFLFKKVASSRFEKVKRAYSYPVTSVCGHNYYFHSGLGREQSCRGGRCLAALHYLRFTGPKTTLRPCANSSVTLRDTRAAGHQAMLTSYVMCLSLITSCLRAGRPGRAL